MKALIVAAGCEPSAELLKERVLDSELIIAADGGLYPLSQLDVVPNAIIGDMDSVQKESVLKYTQKGSQYIKLPERKNDTDTFVALEWAIEQGAKQIVLLGATGKRIDHLLSNIMLLKWSLMHNVSLTIEDDEQVIIIGNGSFSCTGIPGQIISLLPVNERATVTASGLQYPLQALLLTNSRPRGISNVMEGESFSIQTDQPILVFKNK